jgi:hypothetical protein
MFISQKLKNLILKFVKKYYPHASEASREVENFDLVFNLGYHQINNFAITDGFST